jgi:hypothetical protein
MENISPNAEAHVELPIRLHIPRQQPKVATTRNPRCEKKTTYPNVAVELVQVWLSLSSITIPKAIIYTLAEETYDIADYVG